jgi:hypothetical protein
MPSITQWMKFIYLNIGFACYILIIYYFISIKEIKDNWPKYRCNPLFMPLSNNIEKDFTYCVQNMQTNYMGNILQPINYNTSTLTNLAENFTEEINNIRKMFSQTRNFMGDIIENVFGVVLNMTIEFQKNIISLKDIIGKTIGIMTTLLYLLEGSFKTVESLWGLPNPKSVKSLGHCFHPSTKIKLLNGNFTNINKIELGDILENGSKVMATMKLVKNDSDVFYEIFDTKYNANIYVTGTHMIMYKNDFIEVNKHPDAVLCNNVNCEYLNCLITDNHIIQIGSRIFWDYEDREIRSYN